MLVIKGRVNIEEVVRSFNVADSQLPYAAAKALTRTGQQVKAAETDEIKRVFNNPTAYTKGAVYLQTATKTRLQARVWLKEVWSKGGEAHHYLEPQIFGGERSRKRFEVRLQAAGLMKRNQRAIPGQAARMNAYGNISPGQIVQILSQLKTAMVLGDNSNASNSKRSMAKRAKAQYFLSNGPGSTRKGMDGRHGRADYRQHLPAGVWQRRVTASGTTVHPVLIFVNGTKYSKRFDFFGVGERVIVTNLVANAQAAVREAMATARFRVQGGLF
jgi:hypothetical protein